MSQTYSDVDRSSDPDDAALWQERVDSWPAVQHYKARALAALGSDRPVLDVGCGPGGDVVALGAGGAVGLDASAVMCRWARRRGAVVVRADAYALPFTDGAFTGVRADRVVQHLASPAAAIGEMARVVRTGGTVVICDADQGTLIIEVPGVASHILEAVTALRRDHGYRHGSLARRLPQVLAGAGLVDSTVEAVTLLLTDPDDAFGLPSWACQAGLPPADVTAWDEAMARARVAHDLVYAVTYFVVSARRRE